MGGVLSCLVSRDARECESSCLHALADMISGPRRCPHCHENIDERRSPQRRQTLHKGHAAKAVPTAEAAAAAARHLPYMGAKLLHFVAPLG